MNSEEYEIIMKYKRLIKSDNIEEVKMAFSLIEELSNRKNKFALYELAHLYKEGKIVEKNLKKACNLFIFSGELGNYKSFYEAGKIFKEIKDYKSAIRFFEKAKFTPESFLELAKMAEKGIGMSKSKKLAVSYYIKSSQLGNSEADYYLAYYYISGKDTKPDFNKGKYYLKRALRKGIKDKYQLILFLKSDYDILLN